MTLESTLLRHPPAAWETGLAIVFDWYDGPREGLCRLTVPAVEFCFRLLAERPTADGLDDRLFTLEELPSGSVAEAARVLRALGEPTGPLWVPVWKFPSAQARDEAEAALARIERQATPSSLIVLSPDLLTFLGCWSVPDPGAAGHNWFDELAVNGWQTA